jgi:hypothetical protein
MQIATFSLLLDSSPPFPEKAHDIIPDSSEFALLRKRFRPEKVCEARAYGSILFRNRIVLGNV